MLNVNPEHIDRMTEVFYRLLRGEKPDQIELPEDYPDNEIKQLTQYINRFIGSYLIATELIYTLSNGNLDFDAPRGGTLFLHSIKSLQSNLRHLTWKTQQIAKGDFSHSVDFMGDFSRAFNSMTQQLAISFDEIKKKEAETRALMEEVQAARLEAEAAARSKSRFLAGMSHEIRTPMNAVLGFLKLSLEGDLPDVERSHITTAYNSAASLLHLLNDILDISKLDSGRMPLNNRQFKLRAMVRDALGLFEVKAIEKGVDLLSQFHSDLPEYVICDPDRLRQVLFNLVGNALKFTDHGKVVVNVAPADPQLSTDLGKAECMDLHFSVIDTGIGIPAEMLENIFDPFTQADNTTASRFGGTGLGTTISRQLVQLMGGKIWAQSTPGDGSTFHFTIMVERASSLLPENGINCDDAIEANSMQKKSCNYKNRGGAEKGQFAAMRQFRVIVAEDIEENMSLVRIRLGQQKHKIIEARNGLEAVEAFQKENPDIILMDVHMPKMDGLEATRRIRQIEAELTVSTSSMKNTQAPRNTESQRNSETAINIESMKKIMHTPIIALTASIMKEEQEQCFQAGMDAVLEKPVDFDRLFQVMEEWVPEEKGIFPLYDDSSSVCSDSSSVCSDSTFVCGDSSSVCRDLFSANGDSLNGDSLYADFERDGKSSGIAACLNPEGLTLSGIDYERAIKIWQNEEIYLKSLYSFRNDYQSVHENLALMLKKGQSREAQSLMHRLKGVSGNLCINEVYKIADKMETFLIRSRQREYNLPETELEKFMDLLADAMEMALKTIEKLKLSKEKNFVALFKEENFVDSIEQLDSIEKLEDFQENEVADKEKMKTIFSDIISALDEFNPASVMPHIDELQRFTGKEATKALREALEMFDFVGARAIGADFALSSGVEL
ncbi:MAG: response regulator [Desulfamplus sp.]|nr:response regulator [Desulfamplus sp.]